MSSYHIRNEQHFCCCLTKNSRYSSKQFQVTFTNLLTVETTKLSLGIHFLFSQTLESTLLTAFFIFIFLLICSAEPFHPFSILSKILSSINAGVGDASFCSTVHSGGRGVRLLLFIDVVLFIKGGRVAAWGKGDAGAGVVGGGAWETSETDRERLGDGAGVCHMSGADQEWSAGEIASGL